MPIWLTLIVTSLYILGLFAIAWRREKIASKGNIRQSPFIYALALAVYCTSWTYFGAVGSAATSGWDYVWIYVGPALVVMFFPSVLVRIGDIAQRESITSISDFLSARYGKSRGVAATATIMAVAGSLPYIALQLKSVGMSFEALVSKAGAIKTDTANETVLITAIALAIFAILFGARSPDTTKHNPGLMHVLAFESLMKISALIAVCILSVTILINEPVSAVKAASSGFSSMNISGRAMTSLLLSMAAIICLPRQFHVAIIERYNKAEMRRARWLFPVYLLITSVVVVPITIAGLAVLPTNVSADLYVLELPLIQGNGLLALFVFLGGFSAASGMVIVATIALSTMVTNDIIVPILIRTGRLTRLSDASSQLLIVRRSVIVMLLILAYGYYRFAQNNAALAQIGLLSFAAAAQFAPALLGAIYWRQGKRSGVLAGLIVGFVLWSFTLFIPAIVGHAILAKNLPVWLDPYSIFGVSFGDSLTHGVIWSLSANLILFIIVSLSTRERLRDRVQSAAFVYDGDVLLPKRIHQSAQKSNISPDGLRTLASRFLNPDAVVHAFEKIGEEFDVTISGARKADWQLVQRTERLLASAIGASSARVVMLSAIGGGDVEFSDLLSVLDQQTLAERFDRNMLQSMLENIPQGISVVDSDQCLVAWNNAYVDLFKYPDGLVKVHVPIVQLIKYNINNGWMRIENLDDQLERRISHMKTGRAHVYERETPDGRYIRIVGSPMSGGGYVTTFNDITEDKKREQALVVANETLEMRVQQRTKSLEAMANDLDVARKTAEGANVSKTRFLAAASHDLLQPLNAARLFLGAIKTNDNGNKDIGKMVSKADHAIQSADKLLKGLLDISRLDHGGMSAQMSILPLGPLLEDIYDEALPMVKKAGLDIRLVPTRLRVLSDPNLLTSILRNYVSNARRYTQSGGILIGARRVGKEKIRIEIWDTGQGISIDDQERVFDEFHRLNASRFDDDRGIGLGLAVVKRMAELLGATTVLRSKVGKGSVFSVTVMRSYKQITENFKHEDNTVSAADLPKGLAVLCIDDEPEILEGMRELLKVWGCLVFLAKNKMEAEAIMETENIDIMIADYHLRDAHNGIDVITALRHKLSHDSNVCLLTANTDKDVASLADKKNAILLQKPVSPIELHKFLTRCAHKGLKN
ncbi:MAG: hybrid sensor histidine kinase/response regulator [Robiginitomaculum sp.]|nr:hybrid sensor histidine kinase/response regulator [Robiginitomaculum sp.]